MTPPEEIRSGTALTPEMLRQYIERIERLEEEKQALMSDIRDVYAEAKGHGFNPKIMRQVIKLRHLDQQDLQELDAEIESYRSALGMS